MSKLSATKLIWAVVSEALKNSTTFKAYGIISVALLFKQAILTLLNKGHAGSEESKVGVFFVPEKHDGSYDTSGELIGYMSKKIASALTCQRHLTSTCQMD